MSADRRPPWYAASSIHLILLVGAVFFLLPLVWMIATSFKPLEETMRRPDGITDALIGTGYRATIEGRTHPVVRERPIDLEPGEALYIVRTEQPFLAGELALSFGPDLWQADPAFSQRELERMDAPVTPGMRILGDEDNRFDPQRGILTLRSGREVRATLLRTITAPADGRPLWLVRQWKPEDTDAKHLASKIPDVTRAWDILPEDRIQPVPRFVAYNYPVALEQVNFTRSLFNTLFLCIMVVAGTVVSSVLVAYGFAFLSFRGRDLLFALTLATIMIPFPVTMIPIYLLYRDLGWIGTFKPLWVTAWFGNAFFIFLLRQFFLDMPRDLLDAARIDGCSELEILWHVVVPLAKPAIAMVALFTFIGTWKDFLGPLIYLNHESQFTLSLSLQAFASEHGGTPWHLLMAASTVFSLPLIILFFLTMKTFIRGIATSGLKG